MRQIAIYLLSATIFLLLSCDTNEDFIIPIEDFEQEIFEDLTLEQFAALPTPFEAEFAPSPGGRTSGDPADLAEILLKLEEIFEGASITEIEEKEERGLLVWEIHLKMPTGGIVEVVFVQDAGKILKIEGQSGPFDYDVTPGGDFINLSDAFKAAMQVKEGEITRWELELEEQDQWEYEIHLENAEGRWEVEIDAFTGEVIKIKRKDTDDDHDRDVPGETAPDEIIQKALDILEGRVIHSEADEEDGFKVWEVFIRTESEAVVKFTFLQDSGRLLQIKGKKPPFDYDFKPGEDFLLFSEAKHLALSYIEGEIIKWKFGFEDISDDDLRNGRTNEEEEWIYKFHIQTAEFEDFDRGRIVFVNAVTGEILNRKFDPCHEDEKILSDHKWYIGLFLIDERDITPALGQTLLKFDEHGRLFIRNHDLEFKGEWDLADECKTLVIKLVTDILLPPDIKAPLGVEWSVIVLNHKFVQLIHEGDKRFEMHLTVEPPVFEDDCSERIEVITEGEWIVSKFFKNDIDETKTFAGYLFQFLPEGQLLMQNANQEVLGAYKLSDMCHKIEINSDGTGPLNELNDAWYLGELNHDFIKLVHEEDGNNKFLKFSREPLPADCSEVAVIFDEGEWHIGKFLDGQNDITEEYNRYLVAFNSTTDDITVVGPDGIVHVGVWGFTDECKKVEVDIGGEVLLEKLAGHWYLIEAGFEMIKLVHESADHRKVLILTRDPAPHFCQDVINILTEGSWKVGLFRIDSNGESNDETTAFKSLKISFNTNGSFKISGVGDNQVTLNGTWKLDENCRKLILHIEANNPINLFNTTWYIIEISPELVKLVVETPDQRIEVRLVR